MARLCRVHFAGMGEACARFHPLTLDFRHKQAGAPQDSVIWLRNGGGKTTLISLLYSVLVPNQNQFLGRLLGKDTTLTDFLRPNELGVVVTEWGLPGSWHSASSGWPSHVVERPWSPNGGFSVFMQRRDLGLTNCLCSVRERQ